MPPVRARLLIAAAALLGLAAAALAWLLPTGLLVKAAATAPLLAAPLLLRQPRRAALALCAGVLIAVASWGLLQPRLDRDWDATQAVLPRAVRSGDTITFNRARAFRWRADGYDPGYRDLVCPLDQLQGLDLVVSRFADHDAVAHTLFSVRCAGERIAFSPEIRREQGESYSVLRGLFRHYELMYVVADELDILHLRTHVRGERVFIFPVQITGPQLRALVERLAARVEQAATAPRFYNTATASCATSLADDVQHIAGGTLDFDWRVLLPGFSGEMAFELGLLQGDGPFADLAEGRRAHIDAPADARYGDAIRGLPTVKP